MLIHFSVPKLRSRYLAIALVGSVTFASAAEPPEDIFLRQERVGSASSTERLLIDAIFGKRTAVDGLRERLRESKKSSRINGEAWSFLCSDSYRRADYPQAIADCTRAVAADARNVRGDKDTLAIVRLLKNEPLPSLTGTGARVTFDANGHIPVITGDEHVGAVADTGAEISVMMQSVAEKSGVRILGESGTVGTTTTPVAGKIGILPRVDIGGAELRNLPVLVLPDAALTFDEGKFQLRFILSLYALRPFGRIAWLDHGKVLALGDAAPAEAATAVPVFEHTLGIGIPIDGPEGRRAAHFDSGSNSTYLYSAGLAVVSKEERAKLKTAERKIGGVGGTRTEKIQRLPQLTVRIGGPELKLIDVAVAKDTESGDAARVGTDIFAQIEKAVLDFHTMRFSAERADSQ